MTTTQSPLDTVLAAVDGVKASANAKIEALEKRFESELNELSQQGAGYKSNAAAGLSPLRAKSAYDAIADGIIGKAADIANLTEGEKVKFNLDAGLMIKAAAPAAAASDITSSTAPNYVDGGLGTPSETYPFTLADLFTIESVNGSTGRNHYLRFDHDGTAGNAAEVVELATKPSVSPKYSTINVDPFVIAGIARFTNQSAADRPILVNHMKSIIGFQLQQQKDALLWGGSVTGKSDGANWEGLKNLAKPYTGTFASLIDSISGSQEEFYKRGLTPTHVALCYADWLKIALAQNLQETYQIGSYLNIDPRNTKIRGLIPVISNSVTPGSAVVVDSNQFAIAQATPVQAEVGYVADDFAVNAFRLRVEERLFAKCYRTNSALIVTPKA